MNILLESRAFYPSVGGLETVSRLLAEAWLTAGHDVRIATVTRLNGADELDTMPVERNPSPKALLRLAGWSDVFVQSGISLRSLWVSALGRRPLVIIHHGFHVSQKGIHNRLKWLGARMGTNVAVSRAAAKGLPTATRVIPNPFHPALRSGKERGGRSGLLFVGRLVSDKGCNVALDALVRLREQGTTLSLTICGDGPERSALERQARTLNLTDRVTFAGWTKSDALAARYACAEALLVPSRFEPFGVVALEALSYGCPVIASSVGGLPEAVGTCGLLVPPDDPGALARQIAEIRKSSVRDRLAKHIPEHLTQHRIDRVAEQYLLVLERAIEVSRQARGVGFT